MYTVMTVCTGNICRSPMAEIILRTEFERRGLADKGCTVKHTYVEKTPVRMDVTIKH